MTSIERITSCELQVHRWLIEPNQPCGIATLEYGSQMDVSELHQYVSQLRDYIVTIERRIETLEKQVNPPKTVNLGNGRIGLTQHGMNSFFDGLVGRHRKNTKTGEWEKYNPDTGVWERR
jgi:hypothetical protein